MTGPTGPLAPVSARRADPVTSVALVLGARALWAVEGLVLANVSLFAVAVQAVTAELAVGRLGVAWSDPHVPPASTGAVTVRGARGVIFGVGLAALVLGVGLVLHRATMSVSQPAFAGIGVGLVSVVLAAVRDELLLRGAVLRLVGAGPGRRPLTRARSAIGLVAVACVGAANAYGEGASLVGVAQAFALAAVFGALWMKDRGAFRPIGAHVGWSFVAEALTQGGWIDARTVGPTGAVSPFEGPLALAALALAAVVTAAVLLNAAPRDEPSSPDEPVLH